MIKPNISRWQFETTKTRDISKKISLNHTWHHSNTRARKEPGSGPWKEPGSGS